MPEFTLNELANNAGSTAANAGINLAKGAKGLACGLYKNYTGWATKLDLPTLPPAAFVKGVWDTVCADDPGGLPAPPPSNDNFTGGQCDCLIYGVFGKIQFGSNNSPQNFGVYVRGPVTGSTVFQTADGGHTAAIVSRGVWNQACKPYPQNVFVGASGAGQDPPTIWITSVVRDDGQPDNCGNPPPGSYPVIPPPPGALTKDFDITYNDGDSLTVPLTFVDMDNNLNINVDVGGVGFHFNVGGVSFNWNQNKDGDYINIPPPGSGGGSGSGDGSDNNFTLNNKIDNIENILNNNVDIKLDDITINLDDVKDKLNEPDDCCPEPPDPDKYTKVIGTAKQSATVDNIDGLAWLELHITQFTNAAKIQFGDSSPNVLYAGWLEFRRDGNCYERQPIQFRDCIFQAPIGANGYAYCITYAGKARVDYYKKI